MRVFTDDGIRVELHASGDGMLLIADRRGEALGCWYGLGCDAEIDEPVVLLEESGPCALPLGPVVNIARFVPTQR
jgi:hypothetical protein